jgi:ADP-ribose pyrophosphatase YjhB (NUDIX family)
MSETLLPRWLEWAREIQALSQSGLTYAADEYNRERYRRLSEIAAEILGSHMEWPVQALLQDFLRQPGYATPKVDVRGAVVRDSKLLLVQERSDKLWCMPGGWADVGALPSKMVEREVWEESGFRVKAEKIIGVYDANRDGVPMDFYHAYKVVFLCNIVGGEPRSSHETLSVGFFPFDELPALSQNRTNQRHLNELRAHLQDPARPTAFD